MDKAIYVYTVENYDYWGRATAPYGLFGENLTVAGMPDEAVHVGDQFRIGEILVEVTQPRVPCFKLGIVMGSPAFVRTFLESGRVGFYLRVLEEGTVGTGDAIHREFLHPEQLSIRDCMLALGKGPKQQAVIAHALRVDALSSAWREDLLKRSRAG